MCGAAGPSSRARRGDLALDVDGDRISRLPLLALGHEPPALCHPKVRRGGARAFRARLMHVSTPVLQPSRRFGLAHSPVRSRASAARCSSATRCRATSGDQSSFARPSTRLPVRRPGPLQRRAARTASAVGDAAGGQQAPFAPLVPVFHAVEPRPRRSLGGLDRGPRARDPRVRIRGRRRARDCDEIPARGCSPPRQSSSGSRVRRSARGLGRNRA